MLIEELLSQKTSLGGEYRFQPNSLEVRKNISGVLGVFARVPISEGSEILSLPVINGSLTLLRAYEEARELLKQLGFERFNLGEDFVYAAALYTRYHGASGESLDIFLTDMNLRASYLGSPMTAVASMARALLVSDNHKPSLEKAAKSDQLIRRLDVDETLFRCLMAYSISRTWEQHGIIPIFDLLNSSYRNSANCHFGVERDRFKYTTLREVSAGEELTWQYNSLDAISTWLNYGYVDEERPTKAVLELHLDEGSKSTFEYFLKHSLGFDKNEVNPRMKPDQLRFDYSLLYPGKLQGRQLSNEVLSSVKSFIKTRAWLRAFVLSRLGVADRTISIANLGDDRNVLGIGVEKEMIAIMQSALDLGLNEEYKRVTRFRATEIGQKIDMKPYLDMRKKAHQGWRKTLNLLDRLLSASDEATMLSVLNKEFNLIANTKDQALDALRALDIKAPSVTGNLTLRYVEHFLD